MWSSGDRSYLGDQSIKFYKLVNDIQFTTERIIYIIKKSYLFDLTLLGDFTDVYMKFQMIHCRLIPVKT